MGNHARGGTREAVLLREALAVEAAEIQLFDLLHQRIARVGAGALIVEGLFHHVVQSVEEVLLVDPVSLNGLLHADLLLQILNPGEQLLNALLSFLPVKPQYRAHSA